jgi:hypothetical protein
MFVNDWNMNTRTSLGLFVVTALATRLLGGGATQDAEVRQPTSSPPRPAVSAPAAQFTHQLRDRLRAPVTPERGRNPFVYGARHSPAPVHREEPAEVPVVPAPAPPAPIFKLSGIAASQQDGGMVLTAIVNDNGAVVLVKAGDKLSNGFSVVSVDEMSITLIDAVGVTQTLRLP